MDLMQRRRVILSIPFETMIESKYLGFVRLPDVTIPETTGSNVVSAIQYVEQLIGKTTMYAVGLLENPTVSNQIVCWGKLTPTGNFFVTGRFRNNMITTFGYGTNYDGYVVKNTKYAVYEIVNSQETAPY